MKSPTIKPWKKKTSFRDAGVRNSAKSGSTVNMDTRQTTFEALVNAYSADLYRYAFWLCSHRALAEDLVQETFMRAWKALDKLKDTKSAKAWLITILRRENARHFSRQPKDTVSFEELDRDLDQIPGAEPGLGSTEAFVLHQAIAALPSDYREPLLLQVLGGYSCEEIAELLNMKSGTVMTRVFRARQKLRKRLEGDDSDHLTGELKNELS